MRSELVAVLLWVTYDVVTPVTIGNALPAWGTVLLSLGIAVVLAGAAELVRRLVERRLGGHEGTAGSGNEERHIDIASDR